MEDNIPFQNCLSSEFLSDQSSHAMSQGFWVDKGAISTIIRIMKTWLSADLHLGHWNICRYCNRPFESVQDMDDTILEQINARIEASDTFFIVGDFAFSKDRRQWYAAWKEYRNRINCRNVELICGNHDPHNRDYSPKKELFDFFGNVSLARMVRIPAGPNNCLAMPWEDPGSPLGPYIDRQIYLHHYKCAVWPHSHHGSWMGFGHSHGTLRDDPRSLSLDVGIDAVAKRLAVNGDLRPMDYRPVEVHEIAMWMAQKQYSPPSLDNSR